MEVAQGIDHPLGHAMQIIDRRGFISEFQGSSRAPTFGTLLEIIEPLSRSILSGRSEMGSLHGFGRIAGSGNQICLGKD